MQALAFLIAAWKLPFSRPRYGLWVDHFWLLYREARDKLTAQPRVSQVEVNLEPGDILLLASGEGLSRLEPVHDSDFVCAYAAYQNRFGKWVPPVLVRLRKGGVIERRQQVLIRTRQAVDPDRAGRG